LGVLVLVLRVYLLVLVLVLAHHATPHHTLVVLVVLVVLVMHLHETMERGKTMPTWPPLLPRNRPTSPPHACL
jgi:hypothetical protein